MIYNIGSINIDLVYQVPHCVRPGETLGSSSLTQGAGGKGLNQSIALARAGAAVCHIGCIGSDGRWLADLLAENGVDCRHLRQLNDCATGHAIIQVDSQGENAIVLHPGANHCLNAAEIQEALRHAGADDIVLLQNECSALAEAIDIAARQGCQIWFNPAPYSAPINSLPLHKMSGLIVNHTEACALADCDNHQEAIAALHQRYPNTIIICTLGSEGLLWQSPKKC